MKLNMDIDIINLANYLHEFDKVAIIAGSDYLTGGARFVIRTAAQFIGGAFMTHDSVNSNVGKAIQSGLASVTVEQIEDADVVVVFGSPNQGDRKYVASMKERGVPVVTVNVNDFTIGIE